MMRWLLAVLLTLVGGTAFAQPPELDPPPPLPPLDGPLPPRAAPAVPDRPVPLFVVEDPGPEVPRFWADVNYLLYFIGAAPMPELVTTGTATSQGVLGRPGTRIVIGGDYDYSTFNGFRFYSGSWWNECRTFGNDGAMTWLESRRRTFATASDGSTLLVRPIVNALNNTEAAATVAAPGFAAGGITVSGRVRFSTSDSHLMYNWYRDDRSYLNLLFGYRYLFLNEELRITQTQQFLADGAGWFKGVPLPAGATMAISDRFETSTNVFAVQFGARGETGRGCLRLLGEAKVALGWSHQRLFSDGRTTFGGMTVPGGILGQVSYPYRSGNDTFVVVPELNGRVGYQFSPRFQVFVGYSVLYVSSLARPGVNIDRAVNPNVVVSFPSYNPAAGGPARPTVPRITTDLFVHGVSFGLEFRY